ncbi:Listeria/Bacterioides repeat-containing protein [Daejeonella rubra]|uniref:Listeria/Bacterioides repeat-containing protein n=1 Tax=Daejeonella rubra TaxID=990371 RepID=A0A1G9QMW1_9SPHI|nr:ice-binding family protein [Daejeonella rubra]SDM12372.1 Listeria/Bacterioides repeat-containing protein [Daejeonella rubra]
MNKKITVFEDSIQMRRSKGYSKISMSVCYMALLFIAFLAGCKKDDFEGEVVGVCPVVTTDPMDKAVDVVLGKTITATFNTSMNASTLNNSTFTLKQGTTLISGKVGPATNGAVFTFDPDVDLLPFTTYTGTITTGAKDTLRTSMVADYVWTFTTIPVLRVSADPIAGGTVTGAGAFAQGSVVTVNAIPASGYVFLNWTESDNGPAVSSSASYQFPMAGNRTLIANFEPIPIGQFAVVLSANPAAGGTTIGAGSFDAGSSVTVSARTNAGYTFVDWTENGVRVSTSSNIQFTLNANRTFVANFRAIPASQFAVVLSSSPAAGGTTDGEGAYASGTSVTVTSAPNTGYTFTNWTDQVSGSILSTSPAYTFALSANRSLIANFAINTYTLTVNAVNGTVAKVADQPRYNHGSTVVLTATPAAGYVFSSWSGDATSTANPLTVSMTSNKVITANFTAIPVDAFILTVNAVNGSVTKTPNQATYTNGSTVVLTATAAAGYTFSSWSGDATGSVSPLTVTMNSNKNITANFTPLVAVGPAAVNLGTAGDFAILTKSGISTTGVTSITGDIGVSPAAATALTGFGLIMDTNGQSSHTPIVTGKAFASDYAAPTPAKMTKAVADMETAFTTANGLTTPAPIVGLYAGDISGRILPPGLYKWATGVLVTSAGVTLTGGPNDTWVFQIAQNLTINNNAKITLLGGAQAKNIFWVVSGQATIGSNANVSGIILSKTLVSMNTGSRITGKLLAQTAVTLNASTVINP